MKEEGTNMTTYVLNQKKKAENFVKELSIILSDTYVLYIKTQNFHWNIEDPRFYSLHKFFEEQYEALAETIDEIAERIRMLGSKSPGSMGEFLKYATIKEANSNVTSDKMLKQLLADHEKLAAHLHEVIEKATSGGDNGTADLLIESIRFHEKTAWMIRSHLQR